MADLVNLTTDVKPYLWPGQTYTTWDTMLAVIISAVSLAVQKEVGCDIAEATYTSEYASGNGTSMLDLAAWPITAVTSVEDTDGYTYDEGADYDYVIDKGGLHLRKLAGAWAEGVKNYIVTYKAGYTTVPADIKLVCLELIARKWKTVKESGWGESSRSFPGGSVSQVNADGELTKAQLRVLDKYRRPKV